MIKREIIKYRSRPFETEQRLLLCHNKSRWRVWVGDNNYAWKTFRAQTPSMYPRYIWFQLNVFRARKSFRLKVHLRHKNKSTEAILLDNFLMLATETFNASMLLRNVKRLFHPSHHHQVLIFLIVGDSLGEMSWAAFINELLQNCYCEIDPVIT